ncbi:hexose transporter hxt1 [Ascosphaera aggregata]|nr:hexose transporter hxt1 [Ascosphaera aggregata]
MAIPTAFNWMWNFLISFFTPFIVTAIDFQYGYVFTGCLGLSAILIFFGVMETKGRTLEEIDTMYKMGVKPWRSAGFVVPRPEGEASEEFGRQQERAEVESGGSAPASENEAHVAPRLTPQQGYVTPAGQTPSQSGIAPQEVPSNAPSRQGNEALNVPSRQGNEALNVPSQQGDEASNTSSQHNLPATNRPPDIPPQNEASSPREQV